MLIQVSMFNEFGLSGLSYARVCSDFIISILWGHFTANSILLAFSQSLNTTVFRLVKDRSLLYLFIHYSLDLSLTPSIHNLLLDHR
jgi:hypothetical protein